MFGIEDYDPTRAEYGLLEYDVAHGGIITKATWINPKTQNLRKEIITASQAVLDDIWVPETVLIHSANRKPPSVSRVTYTDVKVNEDYNDTAFQLTFTSGDVVKDFIEKKSFIVGLSDKDEKAATRRFLGQEGFSITEVPTSPYRLVFGVVIGLLLLCVAALIGYWYWRKKGS